MIKIKFTEKVFNKLKESRQGFAKVGLYLVTDGFIEYNDELWWHHDGSPIRTSVVKDLDNIKAFPEFYSIDKPTGEQKFVYDSMFEKE